MATYTYKKENAKMSTGVFSIRELHWVVSYRDHIYTCTIVSAGATHRGFLFLELATVTFREAIISVPYTFANIHPNYWLYMYCLFPREANYVGKLRFCRQLLMCRYIGSDSSVDDVISLRQIRMNPSLIA